MTAPGTSRYEPSPRALFTELGDGTAVLLQLDTKFYYTLNATSVTVWKALQGGAEDSHTLAQHVVREYAVELDAAKKDVEAVLDTLESERLVIRKTE